MKTINIKILSIMCVIFFTTSVFSQEDNGNDDFEIEELTGIFKGYDKEQNQFIFTVNLEDEVELVEDYKFTIKDKKVEALFDLKSKTLLGQSFLIKYTVEVISVTNDEDEDEFHEIYTIKNLLLKK